MWQQTVILQHDIKQSNIFSQCRFRFNLKEFSHSCQFDTAIPIFGARAQSVCLKGYRNYLCKVKLTFEITELIMK